MGIFPAKEAIFFLSLIHINFANREKIGGVIVLSSVFSSEKHKLGYDR